MRNQQIENRPVWQGILEYSCALGLVLYALFFCPVAAYGGVLFGYIAQPGYGQIDTMTGATTVLATLPVSSLHGSTYDPATNTYFDFVGTGPSFGFYKINTQTGVNSFIESSGSDIQYASTIGKLFGYIGPGQYGTMDTVTGATTVLATLPVSSLHGSTYDPATNTYFDFVGTGTSFGFYKINTQTGANSFIESAGSDMQFIPEPSSSLVACLILVASAAFSRGKRCKTSYEYSANEQQIVEIRRQK